MSSYVCPPRAKLNTCEVLNRFVNLATEGFTIKDGNKLVDKIRFGNHLRNGASKFFTQKEQENKKENKSATFNCVLDFEGSTFENSSINQ